MMKQENDTKTNEEKSFVPASWKKNEGKRDKTAEVIIIVLILVMSVTVLGFYQYLHKKSFEERENRIISITERVAQLVNTTVDKTWDMTTICENVFTRYPIEDDEDVLESVRYLTELMELKGHSIFVCANDGTYYDSNGNIGEWKDDRLRLNSSSKHLNMITTGTTTHKNWLDFITRLDEPRRIGSTGRYITHLAVAAELNLELSFMEDIGFQGNAHTYVVNAEGRQRYCDVSSLDFITDQNVFHALREAKFVTGGTLEDLQKNISQRSSAAYEIEYQGERYYVACARIDSNDWSVLTFVETEMLASITNAYLDTAIWYFAFIAIGIFILLSIVIYVLMKNHNDKQMLKQQEKVNIILRDAVDIANNANAAKSEFLSHMSHDIRTPINGIMGMTSIAMKNLQDKDRVDDCLQKIDASSKHLLSLINDVLDMSRIESGKTVVNHDPMNIREVAESCSTIVMGQLTGRDLHFVTEFDKFENEYLIGDELHLRQALINILGNAVKFTNDGGSIYFRIREMGAQDGKAKFHFEIEDTGIGMTQGYLQKIWEPFSQETDDISRTHIKGTGLGMAITKKLVDLMNGTIQVESQLEVGSKFTIELAFDIDEMARKRAEEQAEVPLNLTGMKVLLVEDNELNMEIAQVMLEEEGIEITTAENGQIAVDLFVENAPGRFDAILMDVMMPVMDGLTAAQTIRAMSRPDAAEIPIIAMTAQAYEEDIQKTKEAGMNAHLSKPIEMDKVLKTLEKFRKMP